MKLETPVLTTTFANAPLGQFLRMDTNDGRCAGFKVSIAGRHRLLVMTPAERRFSFVAPDDPNHIFALSHPTSVIEVSVFQADWHFSLQEPEKVGNLLVFGDGLFLAVPPSSPSAAAIRFLNLSDGSFDALPSEAYRSPWVTKWRVIIPNGDRAPYVLYAHNWP